MSRIDKLNEAFKRQISNIISNELEDPRLEFVTINRVEVTKDLSYARVYFSVFGNKIKQEKALGKLMDLRKIPELIFLMDISTEYSIQITKELERIENERKESSSSDKEA